MDVDEALAALGLAGSPSWEAIRHAHRTRIRSAHPDAGGDARHAAAINEALDVLSRATRNGDASLAERPSQRVASSAAPAAQRVHGGDDLTEVLMRLTDAAHEIGHVVFVDPSAGLLEVIVGADPGVGQLAACVSAPSRPGAGVPVSFTLDPLGITPAPPIGEVVDGLMAHYRRLAGPQGG